MVGPARQRAAVHAACKKLGYSERRVCGALGVPRSTIRHVTRTSSFTKRLLARILDLVRQFPRFGYRRIWRLLKREGWKINVKRVHRLWRREGLRVPRKAKKRRRVGHSKNGCSQFRAERRNHVWSLDFAWDVTEGGTVLKFLVVIDEFTRECHATLVARSIRSTDVQDLLDKLFMRHGTPEHIRCDNGSEFIAHDLGVWLAGRSVAPLFIAPGSPWENGYGESFISKFRDEHLDCELFVSVLEAQVVSEDWRIAYNEVRPHSSLDDRTPAEFAADCTPVASAPLQQPACSNLFTLT